VFEFDRKGSYVMPPHFGPRPMSPKASGWYRDVTSMVISYRTDREALARYLPAPFEVGFGRECEELGGLGEIAHCRVHAMARDRASHGRRPTDSRVCTRDQDVLHGSPYCASALGPVQTTHDRAGSAYPLADDAQVRRRARRSQRAELGL
jgi:hypothetical protein